VYYRLSSGQTADTKSTVRMNSAEPAESNCTDSELCRDMLPNNHISSNIQNLFSQTEMPSDWSFCAGDRTYKNTVTSASQSERPVSIQIDSETIMDIFEAFDASRICYVSDSARRSLKHDVHQAFKVLIDMCKKRFPEESTTFFDQNWTTIFLITSKLIAVRFCTSYHLCFISFPIVSFVEYPNVRSIYVGILHD
jgi:hypothetical protein